MIVYVETNFVLEVAYLQERHESCRKILELAKSKRLTLGLPAVAAAEARATWQRRANDRRDFQTSLQKHIRELSRSQHLHDLTDKSRDLVAALVESGEESRKRLEDTIESIAADGEIIPLTREIVYLARFHETAYSLSPQDAAVLASVRAHAERAAGPKCFLTQDAKGFANPTVYDELSAVDCKVLANFDDALAYLEHQLGNVGGTD